MDTVISIREVPKSGENIIAKHVADFYGGKGANAAIALARLNEDVCYYGAVGKDTNGEKLIKNLENNGVDASNVKKSNYDSGMCFVMLEENGENRIIVSPGANEDISVDEINKDVKVLIEESSMVLIQLEISLNAIKEIINLCKELDKPLIIDAGPVRGVDPKELIGATYLSPNRTELEALVKRDLFDEEDIIDASRELIAIGLEKIIVKLGEEGSIYVNKDSVIKIEPYNVEVKDTTGAGDSYMAGLCKSLVKGEDITEAMKYASKCAALTITKTGASDSLPTEKEVEDFLSY